MGRNVVLLIALGLGLLAVAGFAMKDAALSSGTKQQLSKEDSLSVTASSAPIDQRQPQHLKTATFALG